MTRSAVALLILAIAPAGYAQQNGDAKTRFPSVTLVAAFKTVVNNKPGADLFIKKLSCYSSGCTMITLSASPCQDYLGGKKSIVGLGASSTAEGDLRMTFSTQGDQGVIVAEQAEFGTTISYVFTFRATSSSGPLDRLVSFQGIPRLGAGETWSIAPEKSPLFSRPCALDIVPAF